MYFRENRFSGILLAKMKGLLGALGVLGEIHKNYPDKIRISEPTTTI
jgi:hypothetical protein